MSTTGIEEPIDDINPLANGAIDVEEAEESDDEPEVRARVDEAEERKKKLKIQRLAQLAAGREIAKQKREEKKKLAADKPDRPIHEVERLRSNMANIVPDGSHIKVFKRVDGHSIWVGDYSSRDTQSSHGDLNRFLATKLYPKHKATQWEVVFVNADNKERSPIQVNIDPEPESRSDNFGVKMLYDEIKELKNAKPQNTVNDTIEAFAKIREMLGGDGGGMDPMTMVLIRDMIKPPAEDPRISRLEAKIEAALAMPPPSSPIQLPPMREEFGFKEYIQMQQLSDARHAEESRRRDDQHREEMRIMREDMKEAREAAKRQAAGGKFDIDSFIEMQTKMKAAGIAGSSEDNDIVKLTNNIGAIIRELKTTEAPKQVTNGATPPAQNGQQPQMQINWPTGFENEAAKVAAATTDPDRIATMLGCYEFLVKSGDAFWRMFHLKVVEHAKAGEKEKVREFVDGLLEGLDKTIPQAQRIAVLNAYDVNADKIIAMLAAS